MNTLLFTADGPWTVRDLKAADAPRALAILRENAQWLQKRGSTQWNSFLAGGEDIVAKRFQDGMVLLVERAGKDAATMTVQMVDDLWDEVGKDGQAAWIRSMAVRSIFMKRGLGKALLGFAESLAKAKQKNYLRLDVVDGASKLKAYYARLGFKELGTKEYNGDVIRLMQKTL